MATAHRYVTGPGPSGRRCICAARDVPRGRLKQAAAPYLGQLALYAGALQQALGHAPVTSLYFLRPGASYFPGPDELRLALAATRSRIDAGEFLADPEP